MTPAAPQAPPTLELDRRVRRVRRLLILVPFTFPAWLRLRAEQPELAATLRLELAINIAQCVILLMLAGLTWWYLANYDAIVAALTALALRGMPVR